MSIEQFVVDCLTNSENRMLAEADGAAHRQGGAGRNTSIEHFGVGYCRLRVAWYICPVF
jgi:very-short-patch-repair endonuclease